MNWHSDTILRWDGPPAPAKLLEEGGIDSLLGAGAPVRLLPWERLGSTPPQETIAVTDALWPGVSRGANARRDPDSWLAGASHQPWVDANGYLVGCLRALRPAQPALLAQSPPDSTPLAALELALLEARLWGGNHLLSLPPGAKEDLLRDVPKARQAWRSLGKTVRWLRDNRTLFGHPSMPSITQAVEAAGESAEFANLLTRHIASPAPVSLQALPPSDPKARLVVVAVAISEPAAGTRQALLAHARAGSTLVVETRGASPWWRVAGLRLVKSESDRDFLSLERGHIVAYHKPVEDPSEFALDVIDILTHRRRPLRLWDAPTVIGHVTQPVGDRRRLVHLVNYGQPREDDFPVRVQDVFSSATMLAPDRPPSPLTPARRGMTTEVRVPSLVRAAVLVLS